MANDTFSHLSVSTRILWWRTVCLKNIYTTMATCHLNPGSIPGGIWHWETMAEQSLGLKLLQVREQWNFYQEKFDNPLLWLQNTMPYLVVIVIKTFLEKHYGTILAKICFIKKFKKTLKVWNFSRPVTKSIITKKFRAYVKEWRNVMRPRQKILGICKCFVEEP